MSAVRTVIPSYDSAVCHEIISVYVACVAVAVVVLSREINLVRVGPSVCDEVRMTPHYTLVHHSDDDVRVSGAFLPSLCAACVKSCREVLHRGVGESSAVVEIPLESCLRVVESG